MVICTRYALLLNSILDWQGVDLAPGPVPLERWDPPPGRWRARTLMKQTSRSTRFVSYIRSFSIRGETRRRWTRIVSCGARIAQAVNELIWVEAIRDCRVGRTWTRSSVVERKSNRARARREAKTRDWRHESRWRRCRRLRFRRGEDG